MEKTKETGLKTKDVNFLYKDCGFNFRVAAFVVCDDHVLLEKSDDNDFWNLVGGRVKLGESTEEAIKRELDEELGIDANKKLIWIAENFFIWQGYYAHEMLYIFKVKLDKSMFEKFKHFKIIDSKNEYTKWVHKSELKNHLCKPNLIYDLFDEFEGVKHTITREY